MEYGPHLMLYGMKEKGQLRMGTSKRILPWLRLRMPATGASETQRITGLSACIAAPSISVKNVLIQSDKRGSINLAIF